MVRIDTEKCTGCALCVKDCFPRNLTLENGKAKVIGRCLQCGHCVAVCPANAAEIPDYDMEDVADILPQKFTAADLVSFIKARRSIRQFQDRPVERELIAQMIQAGRYTPTGSNRQELTFVVVEKKMEPFRGLVMEKLAEKGRTMLASEKTPRTMRRYAQWWIDAEEAYRENPKQKDIVFFGAPVVILLAGDNPVDAGLAASNMELAACASGLGVLYSGFITMGSNNEKAKTLVGVPAGKEVLMALVVGYPDVRYIRSAPRKKADILWA